MNKYVQQRAYRNAQAALKLEEVDVLWGNAVDICNSEEGVMAVKDSPGIHVFSPVVLDTGRRAALKGEIFRAWIDFWSRV